MKPLVKKALVLFKKPTFLIFLSLFVIHLFFRFYELEHRAQFTWDQVDNAWNAKNIIINHEYPLVGMPVKQNTGFFIGPFYYYYVAFFYFLTDLDPIASPIIAGVTSIFTLFTLFFISKKLFNSSVALISTFIYTFSFYFIEMDRIQWPVNFIPAISLIIFYLLLRIINGEYKKIPILALVLGISFHIHFTSLFYFIFIFLCLPFFPRSKKTIYYYLISIPLLFVWIVPTIIYIFNGSQSHKTFFDYYIENSHGFHLRRVMQVIPIQFLEAELILKTQFLSALKYLVVPIFSALFYFKLGKKKSFKFLYLYAIWFVVPLILLSMFRGDLTPYYFSLLRFIVIISFSFIVFQLLSLKNRYLKILLAVLAIVFAYQNIVTFANFKIKSLYDYKNETYKNFMQSKGYEFTYGAPHTYLYYFYEYKYYGKK